MIIDTSNGTHILGSKFGRIITAYRDKEDAQYVHQAVGRLRFVDDWLLLQVDDEIARYYAEIVRRRFDIKLHYKSKWGAHVSIIRGEDLPNPEGWGDDEGREILINYTHDIYSNNTHWWLNVECDELAEVRSRFGLPTNKRFFHLTIGRIEL
jgi:hypothetical protein